MNINFVLKLSNSVNFIQIVVTMAAILYFTLDYSYFGVDFM